MSKLINKKKSSPKPTRKKSKRSKTVIPLPEKNRYSYRRNVSVRFSSIPNLSPRSAVIVSLSYGKVGRSELESTRRTIRNQLSRFGKLFMRVFPLIPITCKPLQMRMGKGKGRIVDVVSQVYPGKIIFELRGIGKSLSLSVLNSAAHKLSVPCKVCYYK